jgi:lipoprotein-anchoring transpeptidase ErfK/SrfK
MRRRVGLVLAIVVAGSLIAATVAIASGLRTPAIGGGGSGGPGGPIKAAAALAYEPGVGATGVNPTAPVSVRVSGGTFADVALHDAQGKEVHGALSSDRTRWTASDRLAYGERYTWSGTATGENGNSVPLDSSFNTVVPAHQLRGLLNIGDGKTVGIAAPIEIQFDGHVNDRAAVEKALSVQTSTPVEGAWGWLPDENGGSRIHYRTKAYWPANTKVTVTAKLFGVDYGGGSFGRADVSSTFTIGRAQIVKADANSHRLVVLRDGKQVANYPASYGLASDPERNTRSGIHVVNEKFTDKRMVSQQYNYDEVEKWAVRMSNNGEFIHANPVTVGVQGSSNVTHGCINLSTDNAKAYYDSAIYGDPVEVTGTPIPLAAHDGDIWDWTLSWDQWKNLSALS